MQMFSFFELGPGAFILIRSPRGIDKFMGDIQTPILCVNKPFIALHGNFVLPTRTPNPANRITGFVLNNMRMSSSNIDMFDTACTGKLCDKQGLYSGGRVANKCACANMVGRRHTPAMALNLEATDVSGQSYWFPEFSSTYFIDNFILRDEIPIGVRANDLMQYQIEDSLNEALEKVLELVNNTGGWTSIGWCKQGQVQDQAAAQEGVYNAPQVQIQAGTTTYHLVKLVPSRPDQINPVAMQNLKMDFNSV